MPDAKGSIREIILPKGLDLDRPKRTRTSFTAEQLYRLEMEFQRCQYVVGRERTELARQLNLSETQVPPGPALLGLRNAASPVFRRLRGPARILRAPRRPLERRAGEGLNRGRARGAHTPRGRGGGIAELRGESEALSRL